MMYGKTRKTGPDNVAHPNSFLFRSLPRLLLFLYLLFSYASSLSLLVYERLGTFLLFPLRLFFDFTSTHILEAQARARAQSKRRAPVHIARASRLFVDGAYATSVNEARTN